MQHKNNSDTNLLALLLWHLDATESEMKAINVTRDDILQLARTFEAELSIEFSEQLSQTARALLVAYRHGMMSAPSHAASTT